MEMATLGSEFLVLPTQHFIIRVLDSWPVTVISQNFQDGNGIGNIDMLAEAEQQALIL